MTTLREAAEKAGIVCKLEWAAVDGMLYLKADTAFGEYIAYKSGAWSGPLTPYTETDGDRVAAQAACQTDFEQRGRHILNPTLLDELDTAKKEVERLKGRGGDWTTQREADAATLRAVEAESALTEAKARIAEMEGALGKIDHEYETEYAGRSYTRCTSCNVATSEDEPHHADCAWVTLSPVKENDRG